MNPIHPSGVSRQLSQENPDIAEQFQKNLHEFMRKHDLPVQGPLRRYLQRTLHGTLFRRKILLRGTFILGLLGLSLAGIRWMQDASQRK